MSNLAIGQNQLNASFKINSPEGTVLVKTTGNIQLDPDDGLFFTGSTESPLYANSVPADNTPQGKTVNTMVENASIPAESSKTTLT